jgi:hypothetical protein
MPEKRTLRRARRDKRQGKAASTQAGEFVRQEMEHVKKGKHGARSRAQAIAIGLSEARRAGVNIPKRKGGRAAGHKRITGGRATSSRRSRASEKALKKEGRPSLRMRRRTGRARRKK